MHITLQSIMTWIEFGSSCKILPQRLSGQIPQGDIPFTSLTVHHERLFLEVNGINGQTE